MKSDFLKTGLLRASQDISVGQECFENAANSLCELLEMEFVIIGLVDKTNHGQINTIAFIEDNTLVENITYPLEGSPCMTVTGRTMQIFDDGLCELFPRDEHLINWKVKSYLGIPVFDIQNKPLGLIALLSKKTIKDSAEIRSLLQIYASKVGSEIDRMKYEEKLRQVNLALEKETKVKTEELKKLTKTMSATLRESEEKYRLLFENNTDALLHMMPEYSSHFTAANKAALIIYGMDSEDELLEVGPDDQSPEFQPDGIKSSLKGVEMMTKARQEGSHIFEWRHTRKNGEEFDCIVTLTSITTLGKNLIQASVRDITESKRSADLLFKKEKELERAEVIAKIGRWKWDILQDKVEWTPIMKEIFGLDLNDDPPPYKDFGKYHTPATLVRLRELVGRAIKTGEPYEIDVEIIRFDGSTRWTQTAGEVSSRDAAGNATGLSGTVQDITHRKQLEKDLQAALKARDVFMGVASHELKTPLTTLQLQIHSLLRIMNDDSRPIPQERVKSKLLVIKRQGERFEQLIKSLLDVSQINSGKLKLKTVIDLNLSELGHEIVDRFQDEFNIAGSSLTAQIEPEILGHWDAQRLDQVISNLISNALKYGDGKPVEVNISKKDDFAFVEVVDHGIGIADETKKKIFERFERAVDEHSFKGLGLGLWIVTEILNSFGGKVWVESELGKGSRFIAQIPIEKKVSHD